MEIVAHLSVHVLSQVMVRVLSGVSMEFPPMHLTVSVRTRAEFGSSLPALLSGRTDTSRGLAPALYYYGGASGSYTVKFSRFYAALSGTYMVLGPTFGTLSVYPDTSADYSLGLHLLFTLTARVGCLNG